MQKFGAWLQKKWHICSGSCFLLSAALLLCLLLNTTGGAGAVTTPPATNPPTTVPKGPAGLSEFTIVTNDENMEAANALAVTLKLEHDVSLKVVKADEFAGDYGIYLGDSGFNSYGGYKYGISWEQTGDSAALYINGSGASLETAIAKWLKNGLKDISAFPFGLEEPLRGYEWNTDDVNMTALGFNLDTVNTRELIPGVEVHELKYKSFAYGKVTGYAVVLKAGAAAELKIAAADWNETHNTDNPAPKHTVSEYAQMLTEQGYEVLAITNAGFYDLNTGKTNIPLGLQIVDGLVKQEPSESNPKHTDNWIGLTVDGSYVISNTEGYKSTYEGKILQGVGGGLVLMRDGVPTLSTAPTDYRTVVGVTEHNDLVILTIPSANYAVVVQAFMDLDLDVKDVLNLDGGGSTTLHTLNESGALKQFLCETPLEREVADSIAIVKKK